MRVSLVALLLLGLAVLWLSDVGRDEEPLAESGPGDAPRDPTLVPAATEPAALLSEDDADARDLLAALSGKTEEDQLTALKRYWQPTSFHPALAKHLQGLTRSEHRLLRTQAFFRLTHMGVRAAPYVMHLLQDEDTETRRLALYVFYNWRSRGEELPGLDYLRLLDDPDQGISALTLNILSMGVPYEATVAERLQKIMLRPPRELPPPPPGTSTNARGDHTPFLAADGLARMGPSGVAILRARLTHEDASIRGMLLRALAKAPPEQLQPLMSDLDRALHDPDDDVRSATLLVLESLDGACVPCLPRLIELTQDENRDLVNSSLRVIAEIGPDAEAAIPALMDYLSSPDEERVDLAVEALGRIHARPRLVIPALAELIRNDASDLAARALAAFGRQGYEQALSIFHGDDPDARHAALYVFGTQGEAAAVIVPELLPLIGGEDSYLSDRAIWTAGGIGPKAGAAVPRIVKELISSSNVAAGDAIGRALGTMGAAGEEGMRRALRSKAQAQRLRALRALRMFGRRIAFALPEIEALLMTEDLRVRAQTRQVLFGALQYPNGFARTPEGVDDQRVRAAVRAELTRLLARLDARNRPPYQQMLEALD